VYFFFQAEDGIRVFHVTGVQTCALPICRWATSISHGGRDCWKNSCSLRTRYAIPRQKDCCANSWNWVRIPAMARRAWGHCSSRRSEERRGGEERRCRRGVTAEEQRAERE